MSNVPNGVDIAENFNRLSRVHERFRHTTDDRQTDGRRDSEREREFTFAKNCRPTLTSWSRLESYKRLVSKF